MKAAIFATTFLFAGAGADPSPPASWTTLPNNNVWVDTRGAGHVQMGYISYIHDVYPAAGSGPSGQPVMTAANCMQACGE